jgi:hypothetical protein
MGCSKAGRAIRSLRDASNKTSPAATKARNVMAVNTIVEVFIPYDGFDIIA